MLSWKRWLWQNQWNVQKGEYYLNTVLLQYALEVEKTGSITQAANNLYMEQPNLSKAIKSLEEMMGAPIFKRSPKGVVPTLKGKVFLEHAKSVLEQIEKMESIYKKSAFQGIEFRLSIPRATYINEAYSRFVKTLDREQGMNLWLKETNSADTMDEVAEGICQMGIIRYPVEAEKYFTKLARERELWEKLIWEYNPMLLMSKDHPLARKKEISYEDLEKYTEIVHGDIKLSLQSGEVKAWKNRIYVFERGSQMNLLQTNTDTYMWVSSLPQRCLIQYGLVQKPCGDKKQTYRDVYIYRQGYELNQYDKRFLKEVHIVKQEMLRKN